MVFVYWFSLSHLEQFERHNHYIGKIHSTISSLPSLQLQPLTRGSAPPSFAVAEYVHLLLTRPELAVVLLARFDVAGVQESIRPDHDHISSLKKHIRVL